MSYDCFSFLLAVDGLALMEFASSTLWFLCGKHLSRSFIDCFFSIAKKSDFIFVVLVLVNFTILTNTLEDNEREKSVIVVMENLLTLGITPSHFFLLVSPTINAH